MTKIGVAVVFDRCIVYEKSNQVIATPRKQIQLLAAKLARVLCRFIHDVCGELGQNLGSTVFYLMYQARKKRNSEKKTPTMSIRSCEFDQCTNTLMVQS